MNNANNQTLPDIHEFGNSLSRQSTLAGQSQLTWEFVSKNPMSSSFFIALYDARKREISYPLLIDNYQEFPQGPIPIEDEGPIDCVCSYILRNGKGLIWNTQDEGCSICAELGVHSRVIGPPPEPMTCLYIPLIAGGEIRGVMSIQSTQSSAFTDEWKALFEEVGFLLAIAIDNTLRNQQFLSLNQMILALNGELHLNRYLDRVLDDTILITLTEGAAIYLFPPGCEEDMVERHRKLSFPTTKKESTLLNNLVENVINRGQVQSLSLEIFANKPGSPGLAFAVGVPIRIGETSIGALILYDSRPTRHLKDSELSFLTQYAEHIGPVILKIRMLEKLREVQQHSASITSNLEMNAIYKRACQTAVELFKVDHSGLVIFKDHQSIGVVRAEYPADIGAIGCEFPLLQSPAEQELLNHRFPINVSKVSTSADLGPVRKILDDLGIRSILVVPIVVDDRVVGSFSLDMCSSNKIFTQEEVELFQAFAEAVAVAVKNAQIFESTHNEQEYIEGLFKKNGHVISPSEIENLLQEIVDIAVKSNHSWRAVVIHMPHPGQQKALALAGFDGYNGKAIDLRENGNTRRVIKTGEPLFIPDLAGCEIDVHPKMREQGTGAAACLPLSLGDRVIGALWLHFREPHPFSLQEKNRLCSYANWAAIAIDQSERVGKLEQIRRAAEQLAAVTSLREVKQQILLSAQEVLEADSVVLWDYDSRDERLVLETENVWGIEHKIWEEFELTERGLGRTAHRVLTEGWVKVVDVTDPIQNHSVGENTRRLLSRIGARSFQGFALKVGAENLGLLYVNYKTRREFLEDYDEISRTFAKHIALALKNARSMELLSNVQRAVEAVSKASIQTDLDETLDTFVNHTQSVLHCDKVTLYAYDDEINDFHFPPAQWGVQNPDSLLAMGRVTEKSVVRLILDQGKPIYAEDAQNHELMNGVGEGKKKEDSFVYREGIIASAGIPLTADGHKVGVMFINYIRRHHFLEDERHVIETFTNLAAAAIKKSQLLQAEQHHGSHLQTIQENSTALSAELDLNNLLEIITQRTAQIYGDSPVSLMLLDARKKNLVIRAAYNLTSNYRTKRQISVKEARGWLERLRSGPQEINIKANPMEQADLVHKESLCSVLVAPLWSNGSLLGVLNIYSRENPHTYSAKEKELAGIFANQVSIAIQNAQMVFDLKKTKGQVAGRTALAWVGLVTAEWRHGVGTYASTIQSKVYYLRILLNELGALTSEVDESLEVIDNKAMAISKKPITPPNSAEEGVFLLNLDKVLQERIGQRKKDLSCAAVTITPQLKCPADAFVRISAEWIQRAFDLLFNNAIEAAQADPTPIVTVSSRLMEDQIEIDIYNNGKTISPEQQLLLFQDKIKKGMDEKGMGLGCVLAQTIVETYGGEIHLIHSNCQEGTVIRISLPVASDHE